MKLFARPSVAVLLVCRANICRSPMAEGILRAELKLVGAQHRIAVDSAGTHASQAGHSADGRALQVCARQGIDLRKSKARQLVAGDFARFDYLLAMDASNLEWLLQHCPEDQSQKLSRIGDWATPESLGDIADPYYGSFAGFEEAFTRLQHAIEGFVPSLAPHFD